MRVGLIDVDGHNFPNLALMKIAAYHKAQGDGVEWANPMFGEYDRVYKSKVFVFTPDNTDYYDCEVVKGGTGYGMFDELPPEIDRMQPDYSIYPWIDSKTAYGFITRGCPNKCAWCIVPKKEGAIHPYMEVDEIALGGATPRNKLVLMDNNVIASDFGLEQIEVIIKRDYRVDFNQALDARLVTPEIADLLARVHWLAPIKFGCDTPRQVEDCKRAMEMIDSRRESPAHYLLFTMLHGSIGECYQRTKAFKDYKRVRIQAQPFRDLNDSNYKPPQWQKDMGRWACRKELYASIDFKEYIPRKGSLPCGKLYDL